MDSDDGTAHRSVYEHPGEYVEFREAEEVGDDDGMMAIRMPIASTGEVRNEGDDPLTPTELRGMATQVNSESRGVFLEHGMADSIDRASYAQTEKLGYWTDGDLRREASDDGEDLLMATARMPDPEELPAATGDYREVLAIIKEQAKRGIPIMSSIGWRDDGNMPGGVDLLETSIVGVAADPRTNTEDDAAEVMARSAIEAGADPVELVAAVRSAVEDARPLGPPDDPDRFDTFDECVDALAEDPELSREDAERICGAWEQEKSQSARAEYEVGDETVEITPPDYMTNAADLAMQKSDDGLGSDCGTGVGDERADQIRNDEVGPDVVEEIAAYLTSHAEDVTAEGTPDEWSDEEWDDCGNMQYAKWGGIGTGTALEWAQARANAVADARDEELPYPDRNTTMTDDDPPDDSGGATEEQAAGDGETDTRAPEDVTEDDLLTFTARHFDGMDESDLGEAVDAADASYIGECNAEALYDFVSVVTGAEYGTVEDAMMDLMETSDGESEYEDGEKEDEDEDDESEQSADTEDGDDRTADLESRLDELESELQAVRSGETDVETPGEDSDESDGQRDADGDDTDADEQRDDSGGTLRDEWLADTGGI
jgi:hypothetical protein